MQVCILKTTIKDMPIRDSGNEVGLLFHIFSLRRLSSLTIINAIVDCRHIRLGFDFAVALFETLKMRIALKQQP